MAMEEFNVGIQEVGLIPLPMQGEWYTWHNRSTNSRSLWKRLDRILINDRWLARFPSSYYHCLLPRTSDHSPLLLHGDRQNQTEGIVQNIWQNTIVGVPMFAVTRKLKALKPVFREQRRKKGDLTLHVQLAKGFLDEAQQLVSSDRQNEAFLLLEHCCRLVYAKAAKLEQIMLQQRAKMQWMKGEEIINEFVCYYQNLLGGNRRQITLDIGFLRPWARHILSNEEAGHLILAFTPDDVKQAAPGPDGYSSGFFKAAWPVVGQEVTKAVLKFFIIGKLLKQVNSTLLALIPKRLSVVLDKIISPYQGAFIPGRSIGDNILLAQELLTGYNQVRLPPRCTLKVDIRKAYDTVEWDFLLAIEECVTTAAFSIGLNGNPHGFFAGARGLRQGDPLSPYLFVLVMEDLQFSYLWKCELAKAFQMGFADDLLLFCRADLNSLGTLKRGLDRFAEWSGLRLNVQKGHVIISRSAQAWKDQILTIMGFQEGQLPMRYLGLPLLSSRLSIFDCQPLLLKIDARINGWEGISLSYTGCIQIIKSVLSAMSIYCASAFILPKAIIKQIEKRLRTFLWKGTSTSGYAKVAWKDVCKPINEGGQGIKDIGILNRSLMAKKLCDVIRCDRTSIWVE
ncbi:UNVERIFIED_CONTAM: Retrovirus-related Pol polyprotein from type-1 retrotransposable element R2 [Sesamum indicum]